MGFVRKITIKLDQWFWCDVCNERAIYCFSCGQTSCSGPGCKKCQNDFMRVGLLRKLGIAPTENIPSVLEFFAKR